VPVYLTCNIRLMTTANNVPTMVNFAMVFFRRAKVVASSIKSRSSLDRRGTDSLTICSADSTM
jgi:hypothetical protein